MTTSNRVDDMNYEELTTLYDSLLKKPGHSEAVVKPSAIGEPSNDGPSVDVLLSCAEALAKQYEPSGSIFVVDIEPE